MEQTVLISRRDYDRLWGFLTAIRDRRPEQGSLLDRLERVLATAKTLPTGAVPPGRITLNSYVTLRERETGIVLRFQLVFPWDSNVEKQRLSVLSSIGTDILGRTVGEEARCRNGQHELDFWIEAVDREGAITCADAEGNGMPFAD